MNYDVVTQAPSYIERVNLALATELHRGEIAALNPQRIELPGFPNGMLAFENPKVTSLGVVEGVAATVKADPRAHIRYASGNTQLISLAEMGRRVTNGQMDMSQTYASTWDEYWPLVPDKDHLSFRAYHAPNFASFGIPTDHQLLWNGYARDPEQEITRVASIYSTFPPVKLTIAGIGPGSHLGYIVPGTPFDVNFKLVELDPETIARDMARNEHVANSAMTVGPAEAKKSELIIVDAFGPEKGDYLFPAIFGPVTPDCPASILQTISERVLFMVDTAAATRVQELAATITA